MKKYKSRSTVRPNHIDETSSPTTTYINSNIKEIQVEDEFTKETRTEFEYDVEQFEKEEYKFYEIKQMNLQTLANMANVEYKHAVNEIRRLQNV